MFRVKICGITSIEDARQAIDAGADAIGLNFYPRSSRYIEPTLGAQIAAAIGDRALKVGVFVNCPAATVRAIATQCRLDLVQLHGDETPAELLALGDLPLMRAFRISGELGPARAYLDACSTAGVVPKAVLVDAAAPGQYGGSGKSIDWDLLANSRAAFGGLPMILAGGLTPDNVAHAIARARPVGVDVASGVEECPGRKSPELVAAFVRAARNAFEPKSHEPKSR